MVASVFSVRLLRAFERSGVRRCRAFRRAAGARRLEAAVRLSFEVCLRRVVVGKVLK